MSFVTQKGLSDAQVVSAAYTLTPEATTAASAIVHPLKPQGLIGELSGNLHARRGDLLGKHALDVPSLLGRHRECGARTFDATPSLLSELRGGLPEERVAVSSAIPMLRKGVVVAQTERFAESIERSRRSSDAGRPPPSRMPRRCSRQDLREHPSHLPGAIVHAPRALPMGSN